MSTYEMSKAVLEENEQALLSMEGVVAVGIGYLPDAESTGELGIHVYVESEEILCDPGKLPRELDGIPVYAMVAKRPKLIGQRGSEEANQVDADTARYRPLRGGIQINLEDQEGAWLGTLGTFVRSRDAADKNLYILSNLHVLGALDRAVYQAHKNKKQPEEDWIATTTIARAFENTDAALAKVNADVEVKTNTIEDIGVVDNIAAVTRDIISKRVCKRGRTTRLTEGTILAINVICPVDDRYYRDCVIVKADKGSLFVDRGDSGSAAVLVLGEEKKLVGLVFASDCSPGGFSYFCTIENVFTNLNVELPKT